MEWPVTGAPRLPAWGSFGQSAKRCQGQNKLSCTHRRCVQKSGEKWRKMNNSVYVWRGVSLRWPEEVPHLSQTKCRSDNEANSEIPFEKLASGTRGKSIQKYIGLLRDLVTSQLYIQCLCLSFLFLQSPTRITYAGSAALVASLASNRVEL